MDVLDASAPHLGNAEMCVFELHNVADPPDPVQLPEHITAKGVMVLLRDSYGR